MSFYPNLQQNPTAPVESDAGVAPPSYSNTEMDKTKLERALQDFKVYKKALATCVEYAALFACIVVFSWPVAVKFGMASEGKTYFIIVSGIPTFFACCLVFVGLCWQCSVCLIPFIQIILGGFFWLVCLNFIYFLNGSIKKEPLWMAMSGGVGWVDLLMVVVCFFFCFYLAYVQVFMLYNFWFAFIGMHNYPASVHKLAMENMFSEKVVDNLTMMDVNTLLQWPDGKLKKWW